MEVFHFILILVCRVDEGCDLCPGATLGFKLIAVSEACVLGGTEIGPHEEDTGRAHVDYVLR